MEDGAVVVALEAELKEIAARAGRLRGPQIDLDIAVGRLEHHPARGGRLLLVDRRHYYLSERAAH